MRLSNQRFFETGQIPIVGIGGTFEWHGSDTEENFRRKGNRNIGQVEYRLNKFGYRGDAPSNVPGQPLFIGCSITLGEGVNIEDTWAHRTYRRLASKDSSVVRFDNFGLCGSGWDYAARTLLQVVPTLRPSTVIAYLPAITRREMFLDESIGAMTQWVAGTSAQTVPKFRDLDRILVWDNYVLYRAIMDLRVIEHVCNAYGVKLVWSCWDYSIVKFFEHFTSEYGVFVPNLLPSPPVMDYARDGAHPGPKTHQMIADKFCAALEIL